MENRFLIPGTIKQGYLTKSPPLDKNTAVFKGWKKRWVILYLSQRELFLQYYENEESARGSSPPKSTVSLRFCEKVDVDLEHSTYKNVFAVHLPERTYYFSAPSHFEMNEWGEAICTYLNQSKNDLPGRQFSTLPSSTTSLYSTGSAAPFGTLPPSTMPPFGASPAPSSTTPYGTYGLAGSSTYGTYGLATQPSSSSASHYGTYGLATQPTSPSNYGSVASPRSLTEIQQRGLPPVPQEKSTATSFSLPTKSFVEEQAPPVPPRFHSNLYSATPTRL